MGEIRLDIGCGFAKHSDWLGVDKREECKPDILVDLETVDLFGGTFKGVGRMYNNTISEIKCWDFLEHVTPLRGVELMFQFWQLLKPGGILDIRVPSTDGRGAFQNPLHVSFWNKNSFLYYLNPELKKEIGFAGEFKLIQLFNQFTGGMSGFQTIHTFVKFEAVKGE